MTKLTKSEINKRYYEKNKETIREKRRQRYLDNIAEERNSSLNRYYKRKTKILKMKVVGQIGELNVPPTPPPLPIIPANERETIII